MTILLDDALVTAPIRIPLTEGWTTSGIPFEVRPHLQAADIGAGDVALISSAEATLLAETHLIASEIAVVVEGIGPIVMRTPVRPDGIEETPIRLRDVSSTGEMLMRALLRPFFGITASTFVTSDDDPNVANAQVVVVEGLDALIEPEGGFQSNLAQGWYILTGSHLVSHVLVGGVDAQVNGAFDQAIATLKEAVALGVERKRDVRSLVAGDSEVDREVLAEMTNNLSFTLDADDKRSLLNLIARGTWGSRFSRKNPVFRDDLPADVLNGEQPA
jgi:hypothetical protein